MVLYKLPISRKASLLAASGYDRVKSYINRVARWSFDEPEMTPLHIIGSAKKLKQWTLVTDSMFGGASACKLGYTKNDTCKIIIIFCWFNKGQFYLKASYSNYRMEKLFYLHLLGCGILYVISHLKLF